MELNRQGAAMPFYLSVPLPGPFRYTKRIGGRGHAARGPFWSRPWFWLSGAFLLYAMAVLVWFECLLIYWFFLYSFKGIRWLVLVGVPAASNRIRAARAQRADRGGTA